MMYCEECGAEIFHQENCTYLQRLLKRRILPGFFYLLSSAAVCEIAKHYSKVHEFPSIVWLLLLFLAGSAVVIGFLSFSWLLMHSDQLVRGDDGKMITKIIIGR